MGLRHFNFESAKAAMITRPREGKKKSLSPAIVPIGKNIFETGKKLNRKMAAPKAITGFLRRKKIATTEAIRTTEPKITPLFKKLVSTGSWL
mgnify:CR=1 FL=1